jgi:hypothetical protein
VPGVVGVEQRLRERDEADARRPQVDKGDRVELGERDGLVDL